MTNLPPVIVIQLGLHELNNARISNMLAVFVDVLQRRLRSCHRTVVLLSLPPHSLFPFLAQMCVRDARIVGSEFFDQDYMAHSGWNFVSLGDGARLCSEAMRECNALRKGGKEREAAAGVCGGLGGACAALLQQCGACMDAEDAAESL